MPPSVQHPSQVQKPARSIGVQPATARDWSDVEYRAMVFARPSVCPRFTNAAFGRRFYNGYADRRSKMEQRLFQRRVERPIRKTIFELNSARLPHQYAGQIPGGSVHFEENLEKIAFRRFTRAQALRSAGMAFSPGNAAQNSVPWRSVNVVGKDLNSSAKS